MIAQTTSQGAICDPCRRCGIDVPPGRALCGDCVYFDPSPAHVAAVLANRARVKAHYWRGREAALAEYERARRARLERHRSSCRCQTCTQTRAGIAS
jgi:hypothetical protein